jgi:hypothetical protein
MQEIMYKKPKETKYNNKNIYYLHAEHNSYKNDAQNTKKQFALSIKKHDTPE